MRPARFASLDSTYFYRRFLCLSVSIRSMPMKRNMSFAGFRLSRAVFDLATNFCSWCIVDTVVVENNVFFGFVYCFPSYFAALIHEFLRCFVDNFHFDFCS